MKKLKYEGDDPPGTDLVVTKPREPETPESDRTRIERLVWAGLGVKTARQIAEEIGIKPDEVLRIKRELLDSIDVLTIAEKRAKLVVDLQAIAAKTQEDYDSSPYEFKAGLVNSSVSAMKVVLVELNRLERADQSKVDALNMLRVRELLEIMRETIETAVPQIAKEYGLDEEELFSVFNGKLQEAATKREASL